MMLQGKTSTGFEYTIPKKNLNDWELLELLTDFEENPQLIVKVANKMLGKNVYNALKEHCKKNGVVLMDLMYTNIFEIMNSHSVTKN